MNSTKTLYQLLNVIIFLILVAIGIGLVLFILTFFNIIPSSTYNLSLHKGDSGLYVLIASMLGVYSVFTFGIWKLKEATKLLLDHQFYTIELIKRVVLSGKCLVIAGVFAWLIDGLSGIYFKHKIVISLTEKTFIYLFIIAMGLFMMLIGNVINEARKLKEEADLTI